MSKRSEFFCLLVVLTVALPALAASLPDCDEHEPWSWRPGGRKALIIANSDYPQPLPNVKKDEPVMRSLATMLGFETTVCRNLTRAQLEDVTTGWGRRLQPTDVAWLHYGGHGGSDAAGDNFLYGVEVDLNDARSVQRGGFALVDALASLAPADLSIAFVDACRKIPRARGRRSRRHVGGFRRPAARRGLGGSVVFFATDLGKFAEDGKDTATTGPFVRAVSEHILTRGLGLRDLFREVRKTQRKMKLGYSGEFVGNMQRPFFFLPVDGPPLEPQQVFFDSRPQGLPVHIDGKMVGTTPDSMEVPPGARDVTIVSKHDDRTRRVFPLPNPIVFVDFLPPQGRLLVETSPPGLKVRLEGQLLDDVGPGGVTFASTDPGRWTLTLDDPCFEAEADVVVRTGKETAILLEGKPRMTQVVVLVADSKWPVAAEVFLGDTRLGPANAPIDVPKCAPRVTVRTRSGDRALTLPPRTAGLTRVRLQLTKPAPVAAATGLYVEQGHSAAVDALAISQRGDFVASGDENGALRLTSPQARTLGSARLRGAVEELVFSADGQRLHALSSDGVVATLGTPTLRELSRWSIAPAWAATFSGDGSAIVVVDGDGVGLRDVAGEERMVRLEPTGVRRGSRGRPLSVDSYGGNGFTVLRYEDGISVLDSKLRVRKELPAAQVVLAPTGSMMLVLPRTTMGEEADGGAQVWDLEAGRLVATLERAEHLVYAAFEEDGRRVVGGTPEGTLGRWDAVSGERLVKRQVRPISSIAVRGDVLVAGHRSGQVSVFRSIRTKKPKRILPPGVAARDLAPVGPNRSTVHVLSDRGRVWSLELSTGKQRSVPGTKVTAVAVDPTGAPWRGFESGSLGQLGKPPLAPHSEPIGSIARSDDHVLASVGPLGAARRLVRVAPDPEPIRERWFVEAIDALEGAETARVVLLRTGAWLHVIDTNSLTSRRSVSLSGETAMAVSTDGEIGVVGGPRGARLLNPAATGREVVFAPRSEIRALAIDGPGRRVAVGSSSAVEVRTLDRLQDPIRLGEHDAPLTGVCFAHGDRLLVSIAADGSVRVWAPDSQVLLFTSWRGALRDWVSWTPEGEFHGSRSGRRRLRAPQLDGTRGAPRTGYDRDAVGRRFREWMSSAPSPAP